MTLRELIAHRNQTQAALAARLGVTQAMVSKWVTGSRRPKWETAYKLAGALDAVVCRCPDGWEYVPNEDETNK